MGREEGRRKGRKDGNWAREGMKSVSREKNRRMSSIFILTSFTGRVTNILSEPSACREQQVNGNSIERETENQTKLFSRNMYTIVILDLSAVDKYWKVSRNENSFDPKRETYQISLVTRVLYLYTILMFVKLYDESKKEMEYEA